MNQITVKLSNIKCMGCASNIESASQEVTGISNVTTQISNGEVSFSYADEESKNSFLELLADKGYPQIAQEEASKGFFKNIFKS